MVVAKFKGLSQNLPGDTEKTYEKYELEQLVLQHIFEPGISEYK